MADSQNEVDELFGNGADAPPASTPPYAPKAGGIENRKESRVRVNWPARVLLPGDRLLQLNLFDLSESGVGLVAQSGIPPNVVLRLAIAVPGLVDLARITPVSGTIRTTHMTVRGADIHCGGTWVQLPSDQRGLIEQWVRRLRR